MKALFTCIFLLLYFCSPAQSNAKPVNIKLHGKVISYEVGSKPYIYYALMGKKFTLLNRFKMDAAQNYTFDLSKTPYKNAASGVLVFSLDSTYDMNHKYSCVHRIDIGEINKYATAKKLNSIDLSNDLVMTFMCESSIMERGANENEAWITGKFKYQSNDTVSVLELKKADYEYSDSSSYLDKDLMNASYGNWKYSSDEKGIDVAAYYRLNRQFGTMLHVDKKIAYKIGNEKGKIVLAPPGGGPFVRQYE